MVQMIKKECVIFGASKLGCVAYEFLKDQYEIKAFLDNDQNKWGSLLKGKPVENPANIKEMFSDVEIIVASSYASEIVNQLNEQGIYKVKNFHAALGNDDLGNSLTYWSDHYKSISLGAFLKHNEIDNKINDLTFISGGSSTLDYFFINAIAQKFSIKKYLEIGTFTGESMAIVSKYAEECYSITLPDNAQMSEEMFRSLARKSNFSRYFCKNKQNVKYFFENSLDFDYSKLPKDLDLVFIDADHSYDAIKKDTENIFNHIDRENCIVIWHDVKNFLNQLVYTTVAPIMEALPEKSQNNFYLVDRNMCGIYIPDKYLNEFELEEDMNTIYSYEVQLVPKFNSF